MKKGGNNKDNDGLSRRKFLRNATLGAMGFAATVGGGGAFIEKAVASDSEPQVAVKQKSKVVSVKSPGVMKDNKANAEVVERMVNEGIKRVSGKSNIAAAWKTYFSSKDVVGLKINPIGMTKVVTRPETVNAIIKGLLLIGVKPNNIIVWDRYDEHMQQAGYTLNMGAEGVRYFSSEPSGGYDTEQFYKSDADKESKRDKDGNVSYFSNILTKEITGLINVPVLKDHSIAGVTLCLKNIAYGVVNNTRRFHAAPYFCDPMTAEVCSHPAVTSKIRLHILDCLEACYEGGPVNMKPYAIWNEDRIMFGTDPVAIDQIGMEIIDKMRITNGKPSVRQRAVKHISTSAKMGLGTDDPARIELDEVVV